MRIYLKLTANKQACPFNYQQNLVGVLHKWLGKNTLHDYLSLYSLSWLSAGRNIENRYLNFPNGATWFVSSHNNDLIKKLIKGIQTDPDVAFGMQVIEMAIKQTPDFGESMIFPVATPVLVQRTVGREKIQYGFDDPKVDELLTETFKNKMKKAGLKSEGVSVRFDKNYDRPIRKKITYKGIGNKGSICPVVVEGNKEAVAFAWDVGIGNSTGIGFGALK